MAFFYLFVILIVCIPVIIRNFDIVKYYSFGENIYNKFDDNELLVYSGFVNSIQNMSNEKQCAILYWDRPTIRNRYIYSKNSNFFIGIRDIDFNEKNDNKLYGYLSTYYPRKDGIWSFCNKTLV